MSVELYMGMKAPDAYPLLVLQDDSGLDMTTVSAGAMIVEKPDGTIVTWAASISGATTTSLVLTHFFGATGIDPNIDIDIAGYYVIYASLTVPGGTKVTERIRKMVRGQFEVPGG